MNITGEIAAFIADKLIVSLGFMSIATAFVEFNIIGVRHLAVIFSAVCIFILIMKAILHPNKVIEDSSAFLFMLFLLYLI